MTVLGRNRTFIPLRILTILPCSKRCSAKLPLRAEFMHSEYKPRPYQKFCATTVLMR